MSAKDHQPEIELLEAFPSEIDAGGKVSLQARVSCPEGCDVIGARLEVTGPDGSTKDFAVVAGEATEGAPQAAARCTLEAPPAVGQASWTLAFPRQDVAGVAHEARTLALTSSVVPHATSVAIWGVPSPVRGSGFTVQVGIKCASGCRLGGRVVEVLDDAGAKVGEGRLRDQPRAGTTALYEVEVSLVAPPLAGVFARSVRFAPTGPGLPHATASGGFTFRCLDPPEHTVTVRVVPKGIERPVEKIEVSVGAYRAQTDARGLAKIAVPKGRYEVSAWRVDIEPVAKELEVATDVGVEIDAEPKKVEDFDAKHWS